MAGGKVAALVSAIVFFGLFTAWLQWRWSKPTADFSFLREEVYEAKTGATKDLSMKDGHRQEEKSEEPLSESAAERNLSACLLPFLPAAGLNSPDSASPALRADATLLANSSTGCSPTVFGLSPSQAAEVFKRKRPLRKCCSRDDSFFYHNATSDTVTVRRCLASGYDILIGTPRAAERLGDVQYTLDWRRNTPAEDLSNTEFAFARCGLSGKEALLRNKFNPSAAERAKKVAERLWRETNNTGKMRPLAVYLLVFDSVSRSHFYRNFPETIDYLNKEFVSQSNFSVFDFVLNNANGENTPPNMISLLYGYDVSRIKEKTENISHLRPDHEAEFVKIQKDAMWKEMERRGFVTLFGFDTVWDYLSPYTGRVIDTDHMISNFFHAARRVSSYNEFAMTQRCLGCRNAHFFPLNYLVEFHHNYKGVNKFAYLHFSTGHEPTGTVIKTADGDLKATLARLLAEVDVEEDVAIMVASDHGLHVGSWDRLYEGFVENQLPAHLLLASNSLLQRIGALESLRKNSQRLVTRYDWHLTLKHLSTAPYGRLYADSPLYKEWKILPETEHARSLLLEEIPANRTCGDVSIPLYYCSCLSFTEVPLETLDYPPFITEATNLALAHVQRETQASYGFCHPLTLKRVENLFLHQSNDFRLHKLRFTIKEQEKAKFDAVIRMSLSIPGQSADEGALIPGETVELLELVRVDEYGGFCEQLAKAFRVPAPFCICKLPLAEALLRSPAFTTKLDSVLRPLSLVVANRTSSCSDSCLSFGKGCMSWAMLLINDERVLREDWSEEKSLLFEFAESGERRSLQELAVVSWKREGVGVRIRETSEDGVKGQEVLLGSWERQPTAACEKRPLLPEPQLCLLPERSDLWRFCCPEGAFRPAPTSRCLPDWCVPASSSSASPSNSHGRLPATTSIMETEVESHIFLCPNCATDFSDIPALKAHYVAIHARQRKYHCDACPKRLPTLQALQKHIKDHTNLKPFVCTLLGCEGRFTREENLIVHLKKKHGLGLAFMGDNHAAKTHDPSKVESGDVLTEILDAKLSAQNSDLDLRVQPEAVVESEEIGFSFGSGVPGFACKWCARDFANPTMLVLHAITHSTNGQLLCAFCFKAYSQRHNFIQHVKLLHTEVNSEAVEEELMRKTGEPLKRFPWRNDEEGKEERTSSHMKTTEFDASVIFICPLCDGRFKHKELMRTHTLIVHQLEGEYVFEEMPLNDDENS